MIGAYSDYQQSLLMETIRLRDVEGMTFPAIAAALHASGWKTPRGHRMEAENIFSVYKKGKARVERLTEPPEIMIVNLVTPEEI